MIDLLLWLTAGAVVAALPAWFRWLERRRVARQRARFYQVHFPNDLSGRGL